MNTYLSPHSASFLTSRASWMDFLKQWAGGENQLLLGFLTFKLVLCAGLSSAPPIAWLTSSVLHGNFMYGCYFGDQFPTVFPSGGIDDTCLQMLQQTAFLPLFMCVEEPERCSVPFVSQGWLRQGYDYHQSQQVNRKKRKTSKPLWSKQGDVERGNKNALHAGCLTRPDPGFFCFSPHFLFFFALCRPLQYILLQFYQHFSPSFQSCWKQHFEWEDEVCLFSCMLSLSTPSFFPPSLAACLPACLHAHLI